MRKTIAAVAAASVFLIGGCSAEADTPTSTTEHCAESAKWDNPSVQSAVSAVKLPDGARFDGSQVLSNSNDRDMLDVIVRICAPGLTGDPLKDVATEIGYAIKQSPISDQVATLRVTNQAEDSNPEGKVRNADFQTYTFSPDVDAAVNRVGWSYPSE